MWREIFYNEGVFFFFLMNVYGRVECVDVLFYFDDMII